MSAGVSLLLTFLVIAAAMNLNARKHYLSFGRGFHLALDMRGLSFFSDSRHGPYRGSVIGLAGNPDPTATASNFPFYYRHFRWSNGQVLWTLSIMLPLVLLPFGVLPTIWLWLAIRHRIKLQH